LKFKNKFNLTYFRILIDVNVVVEIMMVVNVWSEDGSDQQLIKKCEIRMNRNNFKTYSGGKSYFNLV